MENKVEVYTLDEIIAVLDIIQNVQDRIAGEYDFDEEWDMLEEAVQILSQGESL